MKISLLIFFIQLPFNCLSQRTFIEQKALDFYIQNIHQQGEKLYATGKIALDDSPNYVGYIISEYLVCKRRHEDDSVKRKYFYDEYMKLDKNVKGELDTAQLKELRVQIEDPIKQTKKLKYKKLRGGVIGLVRRIGNNLFGEPFNVHVLRHINFEGFNYTMIAINKKDSEFGREYWFRISQEGEVLDYCKSGWIQ